MQPASFLTQLNKYFSTKISSALMLAIALIDEDVIMRLGLTILIDNHFESIKFFEADDLTHFKRSHEKIVPDLLIAGNYNSSKRRSLEFVVAMKKQFPLSRLIIYNYRRLKNISDAYAQRGVQGYLLRQNIGTELIECIKTVQRNQYHICSEQYKNSLSQAFQQEA